MEELALESNLARSPVDRIACDRQVDGGEVDADLMRSSGLEPDVQERVARQQLDELEVRDRVPRRVGVERVAQRITAIPADRSLDASGARTGTADDECEVAPFQRAAADERLQPAVRLLRARDDH